MCPRKVSLTYSGPVVLVPAPSPEQTERLIHAVAGSRFYAPEPKIVRAPRDYDRVVEATDNPFESGHPSDRLMRPNLPDDRSAEPANEVSQDDVENGQEQPRTEPVEPRSGRAVPAPADRTPRVAEVATTEMPTNDPSVRTPNLAQDAAVAAAASSAKADLGLNAQLMVTHLLSNYTEILPRNPRLIIRVAAAWAMLRAVATSLQLEKDSEPAREHLVRAAVIWVRFPILVDELLDAYSPPIIDPTDPNCSPRWRRPDVQAVLTMRSGQRMDIADLALYYGTYFAPAVAGPMANHATSQS